jgi:hypothetical protein
MVSIPQRKKRFKNQKTKHKMENKVIENISKVDWREVGITSLVVLGVGFVATLGALVTYDMYKEHRAKKGSEKSDSKKA